MGKVGALCLVVLLVSVVVSRPSDPDTAVTKVVTTGHTEVTSFTEHALGTTKHVQNTTGSIGETNTTDDIGEADTTGVVGETNTTFGVAPRKSSTENVEVVSTTGNVAAETTIDFVDVIGKDSTGNVDVSNSTEDPVTTTVVVDETTTTTWGIKLRAATDTADVANLTGDAMAETTTDLTDGATITVIIDTTTTTTTLEASAINVEVVTTGDGLLETTTKFTSDSTITHDIVATTAENVKVTTTTGHAEETTTEYTNLTNPSGVMKQKTTESFKMTSPAEESIVTTTEDIEVATTDGVMRTRKLEPEPFVNSSVILPCFTVNARRGITPFIAHPYDLDAELAAWTKKKLPTKIAFMNNDNSLHFVDLTERPQTSVSGLIVKEYGDKVSLYLHTRHGSGSGVRLSLDVRQIFKSGFDPTLPTKVIAHGFWSSINSASVQKLINAYVNTGYFNVITVDWSSLVYGFYSSAREEANGVGDYLSQFLRFLVYEKLVDPKKLHLVGHSLGAHLVGFAGKRAHQDGWGIMRITGLDPALPYFTLSDHTGRLDSSDADVVDIIHTCANFLGMTSFLGDIDFYPNEGTNFQPGCSLDVFGICSHGRAVEYFAESISEPTAFVGKFCDLERSDLVVKADSCPGEPIALMGEWLEYSRPGRYILRTASSPPYGVGLDILYPAYLYKQARNKPSNSTAVFMEMQKH